MRTAAWQAAIGITTIGIMTSATGNATRRPGAAAPVPPPSHEVAQPVNIAHRGASAYAPEHTLAAYQRAIDMGADFVEQDLQLTRDGVLVCLHDPTLERTTDVEARFPDRATLVGADGSARRIWRVSDFDLAEIKQLDAGSWFDPQFAGERVPTFQDAIDLVAAHPGRVGLYPETKLPEAYRARGFSMEAVLVELLRANGLDDPAAQEATPIFIQSFSPASLQRVRALSGRTYRLIQLIDPRQAETMIDDAGLAQIAAYADGIGPSLAIVMADPTRVAAARGLGLAVHPYTVRASALPAGFPDVTAYMRHLLTHLGVTGVFTDHPDRFPPRP